MQVLDPAPPPIHGGTLAEAGGVLVVADTGRDEIHVVDTDPLRLRWTFSLAAGVRPERVVATTERAWVVLAGSGEVAFFELGIEPGQGSNVPMLMREYICPSPTSIALAPDDLYAACAGGDLYRIAGGARGRVERVERVNVLDLPLDVHDLSIQGSRLTLTGLRGGALVQIDLEHLEAARQRSLPALTSSDDSTRFLPSAAPRSRVEADAIHVLYAAARVGAPRAPVRGNPYLEGGDAPRDRCAEGPFSFALASVSDDTISSARLHLDRAVVPVDFAFSRSDGRLRVAVVSATGVGGAEAPLQVFAPVPGQRNTCFDVAERHALPGQAVSVVAAGDEWAVQMREPAALWLGGETLVLSERSVRDTGHDLFYLPLDGQAACASCHLEGLDDGHLWTTSGGTPERTLSLAGGVSERLAYSWNANEPALRALVRAHFEGAGATVSDAQVDAFVRYADTLQSPPLSVESDVVVRGEALFAERCAGCHGGDGRALVATAELGSAPRRVPDLIGVGQRSPLMRTGCADSLEALMVDEACSDDAHQVPDADDRRALKAFLRSLR